MVEIANLIPQFRLLVGFLWETAKREKHETIYFRPAPRIACPSCSLVCLSPKLESSVCIPSIWSDSDLTSLHVFPILVLIVSLFVSGQKKYGFEVSIVVNGVKIVYVPLLPGHSKRLDQKWVNVVYSQLRYGIMKQFPSCCQSENKEIQVPLGSVGRLSFSARLADCHSVCRQLVYCLLTSRWGRIRYQAENCSRKLDAKSIFPIVMELFRLQPFWWFLSQ